MATEDPTIFEVAGIMQRGRSYSGGQYKAVIGIRAGILFKPIVRDIIFDSPVWLQISREFKGLSVFIEFVFDGVSFFF